MNFQSTQHNPTSSRFRFSATPTLFALRSVKSKCLAVFQSISQFFAYEGQVFYRHFSRLPATIYFSNLGSRIAEITSRWRSTSTATAAETIAPELLERLEAIADGRFETAAIDESADAATPRDPLSALNETELQPGTATALDLETLPLSLKKDALLFTSNELQSYLPENFAEITTRMKSRLDASRDFQTSINSIASEGALNYESARNKLETKAADFARTVAAMEESSPIALYVPMGHGSSTFADMALTQLGQHFLPDSKEIDLDDLKTSIRQKIHDELIKYGVTEKFGNVVERVTAFKQKLVGENPSRVRQALVESLSDDLVELFSGVAEDVGLPADIIAEIDQLPTMLEGKIDSILVSVFDKIDEKIDVINRSVGGVVPPFLQSVLAEANVFVSQQFAYFIIEKTGQNFRLTVYPSLRDPAFYLDQARGYHSPLVYENIPAGKMDAAFFYRAFSYQMFLKEQGVDAFALHHMKEGLLNTLNITPTGSPNAVDRNFNDQTLSSLEFTLIKQEIINELHITTAGFDTLVSKASLEWKFDRFLQAWSYFYHNQPHSVTVDNVEKMIDVVKSMAKRLLKVQGKSVLTTEQFQRQYATLFDAAKELKKHRQQLAREAKPLPPSLQIPPEFREAIAQFCGTESAVANVQMLRNALVEVMGEETDEALDAIIKEMLPVANTTPAAEAPVQHTSFMKRFGINSVFGVDEMKKIARRGKEFYNRPSLLRTVRVIAAICEYLNRSVVGVILGLVVKALMLVMLPGAAISAIVLKVLLDTAARKGTAAISAVLPKPIANAVIALLQLYNEISTYLKKRVAMIVLRAAFRTFLKDQRDTFKHYLDKANANVTRGGELHYDVVGNVEPQPLPIEQQDTSIPEEIALKPISNSSAEAPITPPKTDTVDEIFRFPPRFDYVDDYQYCGYDLSGIHRAYTEIEKSLNKLDAEKQQVINSRNPRQVESLLLRYFHAFVRIDVLMRLKSPRSDEGLLNTMIPCLDPVILKHWQKEPLWGPYHEEINKWFLTQVKSRDRIVWSKANYIASIPTTQPSYGDVQCMDDFWRTRFHSDAFTRDYHAMLQKDFDFDAYIEKIYFELSDVDSSDVLSQGRDIDFQGYYFLWHCGKLFVKICRDVGEIHTKAAVAIAKPPTILDESSLDVNVFSSASDVAKAYEFFTNRMDNNIRLGVSSAQSFIVYFRVAAATYAAAQRELILQKSLKTDSQFTMDEWERSLPVPNYLILQEWFEAQRINLTPEQVEEVELLLEFFTTFVPEGASCWDDITIANVYNDIDKDIPTYLAMYKKENPLIDLSLSTHFKIESWRETSDFPAWKEAMISRLLRLGGFGEYFFEKMREQIPKYRRQHIELFYAREAFTESNVLSILKGVCALTRQKVARKDIQHVSKIMNLTANDVDAQTHIRQLILRLPIPERENDTSLWSRIDNADEIVGYLHELALYMVRSDRYTENITAIYTLYVIAFHLMKQTVEGVSDTLTMSGFEYISRVVHNSSFATQPADGAVIYQMEALLRYFDVDAERRSGLYDGKKTDKQLHTKLYQAVKDTTRFSYPHPSIAFSGKRDYQLQQRDHAINMKSNIDKRTYQFYKTLAQNPVVAERLANVPFPLSTSWQVLNTLSTYGLFDGSRYLVSTLGNFVNQRIGTIETTDNFERDFEFVNLFSDATNADGETVLPKTVKTLREIEYLALGLCDYFVDSQHDRKTSTSLQFGKQVLNGLQSFDQRGFFNQLGDVIIEGGPGSIHLLNDFSLNTCARSRFSNTHLGARLKDALRYRGETFLRALQFAREKKVSISEVLKALINDKISIMMILRENEELIFRFEKELLDLARQNSEHYNTFMSSLIYMAQAAAYSGIEAGWDVLKRVRRELRSDLESDVTTNWSLLHDSYFDEQELLLMTEDEQLVAMLDLGTVFIRHKEVDASFNNFKKVLARWKPLLIEWCNNNPEFLDELLLQNLRRYNTTLNFNGPWNGLYPIFTNGTFTVNLEMLYERPSQKVVNYNVNCTFPIEKPIIEVSGLSDTTKIDVAPSLPPDELRVDLTKSTHGLELLKWFQPLNAIEAYAPVEQPERLSKLVFPAVSNLTFNIEERNGNVRAYSEGTFPGYFIAAAQNHDSLKSFSQYLLLENDEGECKVLILPQSPAQLAATTITKFVVDVTATAGISKFIPRFTKKAPEPLTYMLNDKGELISETPDGLAYLLAFFFSIGDKAQAMRCLAELEELVKKQGLSISMIRLLGVLITPCLISNDKWVNTFACRLVALIYETDLLFLNAYGLFSLPMHYRVSFWLLGQKVLLNLIKQKTPMPISELTELNLLKGLTYSAKSLADGKLPQQLSEWGERLNIGDFVEGLLLHPTLTKRYARLRKKYLKHKDATIHHVIGSLLSTKSTNESSAATSVEGTSASTQESGSGFLMNTLEIARIAKKWKDSTVKKPIYFTMQAFLQFDFKNDALAAPVELSKIKGSDITRYFVVYICMLQGIVDHDALDETERELYHVKSMQLRKAIAMMKGNYNAETRFFVKGLRMAAKNLRIFEKCQFYLKDEESYPLLKTIGMMVADMKTCSKSKKSDGTIDYAWLASSSYKDHIEHFWDQLTSGEYVESAANILSSRGIVAGVKTIAVETAKSVMPLGRYYYNAKRAIYVMTSLYEWCERGVNLIRKHNRIEAPVNDAHDLISEQWAGALQERDGAIDRAYDYLLNKYFVDTVDSDEEQVLNEPPKPFEFSEKATAGKAFAELLQSHYEYHDRDKAESVDYAFTGNSEEFKTEFRQLREATIKRITEERTQITTFANQARKRAAAVAAETIDDHLKEIEEISFDEVFSLILKGNRQKLMTLTGLNAEEAQQLAFLVNLHLVAASRWDCLFQEFDNIGNNSLDALGKALASRRSYTFSGRPARLVLGFLAFEAKTGKVLWEKQVDQFGKMLLSPYNRNVLELIMGSGKTAFGMPLINYYVSDRKKFILNIWPKPTAPTNIEETSKQVKAVYAQSSWAFSFTRDRQITPEFLEAFYVTLIRAQTEGQPINMTKEDLQALELNFVELLHTAVKAPKIDNMLRRKIELFQKILHFIQLYAVGNVDEAHENFSQKKELIFPIGRKKTLSKSYCKIMERVLFWVMSTNHPDLASFKDSDALLHQIDERHFRENISPLIHERAAKYYEISEEHRQEFYDFLHGRCEPDFVKEHLDYAEITLVKGTLLTLLPFGFNSTPHVGFTVSKEGNGKYVRPAEGNDKPNERATIQSPLEAFIKTCIFYLKARLSVDQAKELITHMQKAAEVKAKKLSIAPHQTSLAKNFLAMSGGRSLLDAGLAEDDALLQHLIKSDLFTTTYVRMIVGPTIEYYGHKCASNSHAFASMLETLLSCTGTPDNHETYPEGTHLLRDPGTQGECVAIIREKCGTDPIPILQSRSPLELLTETLLTFFMFGSDYYSIIDRGALYRGLSNEIVSTIMLQFTKEHNPAIKGVVFWNDQNIQMVKESGAEKAVLFKYCKLKPHERLTYFDETHTYAADVPQPKNAKAVMTFAEHTRLDGGFQAFWRMRGLKQGQSFTLTTTQSIKEIMGKETVRPDDVIEFFVLNTDPYRMNENYENASKLMFNVIRSAFMQKILAAPGVYDIVAIFKESLTIFVEAIADDPIKLFGGYTLMGTPEEALELYKQILQCYLQSALFTQEEKDALIARLDAAMIGDFPQEVIIRKGTGVDTNRLGQQIEMDANDELDDLQENENLMENQQQQQQQQVNVCSLDGHKFWYWPKDLDLYQLQEWLMVNRATNVPVHKVADLCDIAVKPLAKLIPSNLLATNNFAPIISDSGGDTDFTPFISKQQPAYQILIIQRSEGRTYLMVDQKEANILRKRFKRDRELGSDRKRNDARFALYDVGLNELVSFGYGRDAFSLSRLHRSDEFNTVVGLVKVLNGATDFREEELECISELLQTTNPKRVKKAYENILEAREGEQWATWLYKSPLYSVFLQHIQQYK